MVIRNPKVTADNRSKTSLFEGISAGSLEVRLAKSEDEIKAAQALRYRVFYEEMGAIPSSEMKTLKRDFDRFDEFCDHLLVLDNALPDGPDQVVGTYRLYRRSVADQNGGFYSANEFDISAIINQPGEILELGRSCVHSNYRNRATMTLLWRGNAAYVIHHKIPIMFGCASFPGSDPKQHALPLAYLYHYQLAPKYIRPVALTERYINMNTLPKNNIDQRAAIREVPPLIKGYLRLGGFIGDGGVIDTQWDSVDVSIVVKTDLVTQKYREKLT
ncbi:MAG: hemolysin-like protein [Alphaproteobacteria bacterium]|nr:hemolysin-like protein [Alphaproteobacteria bacterium]